VPARVHLFRGSPAVTLSSDRLEATLLPELGMLGTSLRRAGEQYLSLPGGLGAWRRGHTTGMPLLHPWANRLGAWSYRFGTATVRLPRERVQVEQHGLPIHGVMVGERRWEVVGIEDDKVSGSLVARFAFDQPRLLEVFPFAHEVEVTVRVVEAVLEVITTVRPTGRRRVPVAFGWHPYFRLPDVARRDLVLKLPPRHLVEVDEHQIPTGEEHRLQAERTSLAERTFDEGYRLGRDRALALEGGGRRLTVELDGNFPYAQVFAPKGKPFVALEPMSAPADALRSGRHPVVAPGDSFSAAFTVTVG
jgi:aldose 1-epimerase